MANERDRQMADVDEIREKTIKPDRDQSSTSGRVPDASRRPTADLDDDDYYRQGHSPYGPKRSLHPHPDTGEEPDDLVRPDTGPEKE